METIIAAPNRDLVIEHGREAIICTFKPLLPQIEPGRGARVREFCDR